MIRRALPFAALAIASRFAHAAPGDATRPEYARSAAAESCPDRDALCSAVRERLGYDPFFPAARQTIVVEITDQADDLRAQMYLVDEQGLIVGSRELHEQREHCDELVASLALAISIALDPSAALGGEPAPRQPGATSPSETAPEPGPSEPSAPEADSVLAVPRKKARARRRTATRNERSASAPIAARAGLFAATGVAPALGFGVLVGASMRRDWFQLQMEYAHQFRAHHDAEGVGVQASLDRGSMAPCFASRWLAACALLHVGVLSAEGRGVTEPAKNRSLYAALGARLEATPELIGHLRLVLNADAFKSLTPVTLRLRGEPIWQTPFVSGALGLGLQLQFL